MIKVLIVHPDQKITGIYQPKLAAHFSLDSASDGLTALRKLKLSSPNLIVSDFNLPLLSGTTLLKFIRSDSRFAHLPFLFLTDHTDPQHALSFGANDWLSLNQTTPNLLIERIYYHLKLNPHALQVY